MATPPHVVDENAVPWQEGPVAGTRFASRIRSLGRAAGGQRLGCSLYEVEPGRTAFPFHAHFATEEAIYVLAGTGRLRIGEDEVDVGPGSYAAFPPGDGTPHQLVATGDETLRYLCLSATVADLDACVYPDSGKVAVFGRPRQGAPLRAVYKADSGVGYFDDEDVG